MTGHKRKASTELTSNSVAIIQPVVAPTTMINITDAILQAWAWCKNWCSGWLSVPSYSTMSYTSNSIVSDTHIQSSETREDGTATLKRQKMRTRAPRSRSAVVQSRKGGRGKLDYTGCVTEQDIEKRNQDFWEPPEFPSLKISKYEIPRTPDSPLEDEEVGNDLPKYRRRSDSFLSPCTSQSLFDANRSQEPLKDYQLRSTMSIPSRTMEISSRNKHRSSGNVNDLTLDERMRLLLVTSTHEKEDPLLLPSQFIVEKRTRLAKERKIKEREAAIRAARELRLNRRFPLKPLVRRLDEKWEDMVRNAEMTSSHHQIITTSIGGIELRIKDFRTLLGKGAWLNDEIVNSYLEWIVDAANKASLTESDARGEVATSVPKFIAHNSFFYSILDSKGATSTERLMKRKKAPGKSLMEVDSVFVPICKGNHWTVGVVRPIAKTIEYFDSFGGSSQRFIALMRSWLQFQLGEAYIEEDWRVPNTECAPQSNGYDCGVFVCTNSLCVALGLDTLCYTQHDLAQQRRNIAAVLINRGFTGDFSWELERL